MSAITPYLRKQHHQKLIQVLPDPALAYIVVIPCHDEPDLAVCLNSLEKAAKQFDLPVEVIIVINDSGHHDADVINRNNATLKWLENQSYSMPVYPLNLHAINSKKAGVGYARKIGMDEACARFECIENEIGILISLDADTYVEENYFDSISRAFEISKKACQLIYFEHDVDTIQDANHQSAILNYELHLRYYIHALRFAGFPHAFQTLGSAFAVRANAYAAAGGMKPAQAGEDFYFIHKFSIHDEVAELNSTTVHPSSRVSHRVPFGTGKAIQDALGLRTDSTLTYPWQAFLDLKTFVAHIDKLYTSSTWRVAGLPPSVCSFLEAIQFDKILEEIKNNTGSVVSFRKRFFQKMNAFMMMKYIHHARDDYYGKENISVAAIQLVDSLKIIHADLSKRELLEAFRAIDRGDIRI